MQVAAPLGRAHPHHRPGRAGRASGRRAGPRRRVAPHPRPTRSRPGRRRGRTRRRRWLRAMGSRIDGEAGSAAKAYAWRGRALAPEGAPQRSAITTPSAALSRSGVRREAPHGRPVAAGLALERVRQPRASRARRETRRTAPGRSASGRDSRRGRRDLTCSPGPRCSAASRTDVRDMPRAYPPREASSVGSARRTVAGAR